MTIIEPNKRKKAARKVIFGFGPIAAVVLTGVAASIWLYSDIVELRHAVQDGEVNLQELIVENAELKNRFFDLVDADELSEIAEKGGLVLEKYPSYLGAATKKLANSN